MATRLSGPARLLTLLFAALQFALPGIVSLSDGAAARGGRNSATHVESKGDRDCKPPHSADCAVCRYLTATFARSGDKAPQFDQALAHSAAIVDDAGIRSATFAALHRSRAPPTE